MRGAQHSQAVITIGADKLVPWLIVLTAVASVALTIVILVVVFAPSYIDAKIAAGVAQANAVSHTAETHARVALDRVMTAEVELGKKGIEIRTDGH
jgi:hypothetical protein